MSKYKLSDEDIFKPTGRKLTPEEEKTLKFFWIYLNEKG